MAVDTIARALALKAAGGGNPIDLSNYVQFNDYASATKAGVIKATNYLNVTSDGVAYVSPITQEIYESTNPNVFIAKGTLENIKDDYVGSSTPVKNLNNSLRDLTPKQNVEGTDNTFDDGLESPLYALGGDGKSEQVTTTGKNKYYGTSDKYTFTPSNNSWYDVYGNKGISGTNLGDKTIYKAPVNHGKQYTFSASIKAGSNLTNMQLMYDDETAIKTQSGSVFSEHTFTASKDGYVICRMFINSGEGITVSNVQLEEGSVATEYEPYTNGVPSPSPDYEQPINSIEGSLEFACTGDDDLSNQVTFNLGEEKLRSVGDVKDELVVDLDTGDYYKTENIKEIEVNSTNFTISKSNIVGNIQQFYLTSKNSDFTQPAGNVEINNKKLIDSNYFKGYQYAGGWNVDQSITSWTKTQIRINTSSFSEIEQLSNFLDSNDVIANYVTSTPTTKKLGTLSSEDLAKLKTFKGYNNVTVNTNLGLMNIRFTYGLDIKKYVDNKIAELSAQLIKGE